MLKAAASDKIQVIGVLSQECQELTLIFQKISNKLNEKIENC